MCRCYTVTVASTVIVPFPPVRKEPVWDHSAETCLLVQRPHHPHQSTLIIVKHVLVLCMYTFYRSPATATANQQHELRKLRVLTIGTSKMHLRVHAYFTCMGTPLSFFFSRFLAAAFHHHTSQICAGYVLQNSGHMLVRNSAVSHEQCDLSTGSRRTNLFVFFFIYLRIHTSTQLVLYMYGRRDRHHDRLQLMS